MCHFFCLLWAVPREVSLQPSKPANYSVKTRHPVLRKEQPEREEKKERVKQQQCMEERPEEVLRAMKSALLQIGAVRLPRKWVLPRAPQDPAPQTKSNRCFFHGWITTGFGRFPWFSGLFPQPLRSTNRVLSFLAATHDHDICTRRTSEEPQVYFVTRELL